MTATALPAPARAARPTVAALRIAYSDLSTIARSLSEEDSWRPTRCSGWSVRDLLLHLLGDAQRGLVALATPAAGPPDRDAVTYWATRPRGPRPDLRTQRIVASTWALGGLADAFADTARAVAGLAARTPAEALVATHDHVLRADDLVATLVVESAVHHLDLVADLRRPPPRAEPLAVVRRTLDGLLGRAAPPGWSDDRWALLGSGRVPPGGPERRELGPDVARLPLLGCA
jgi:Mycothiol maleylpyruvate isomerase N-terminal domain